MRGLQIWAVDDGEKIFREDVDNPLQTGEGNSVWDGKGVRLWAGRNEVAAFQLIFRGARRWPRAWRSACPISSTATRGCAGATRCRGRTNTWG